VGIAPAVLGVVVVVGGTVAVGLVDLVLDALFVLGLQHVVLLAVSQTPPLGGVDEDAQHVLAVAQDIVAAAAHDDAGAFVGQLLDDAALQDEDLVAQRKVIAHRIQAVQQAVGVPLLAGGHGLLGQSGILGGHRDQFLVVELDAQCACHVLGDVASAGAVLTAQSDDRLCHNMFLPC
jgi:hypothetical protein